MTGQPWRWRRPADAGLAMDALVDELLLARGVAREDLPATVTPRIRDFLPDPSCFQDMDKGARRLADAVEQGETIAIFGDYDVDGATARRCWCCCCAASAPSRWSIFPTG